MLKELELQNNEIKDITVLKSLTALDYLDLRGNPVKDYGPLRGLSIGTLYTDENQE